MLTLSQYATKYDINIHTLRSWVKKGKIDGATLQNNKWYVPDASINNADEVIDIMDVIRVVQEVLEIESFRGAVNWIDYHFPELDVYDRLKANSIQKILRK